MNSEKSQDLIQSQVSSQVPFYIAIAGNIGVGKTTLTRKLAEHLQWQAFFERVIDNPYLDDFYKDMHRWSFNLQVYFLSHRFNDQQRIFNSPQPCVQDRSIYEDVEIFARILHEQGYMSDRDFENYHDLFYIMTRFLRKPDLIVYLRAPTWTLITRIRKRGRDYEKRITTDYLHQLNEAYERWIKQAEKEMNVLIIEAERLDFEQHPEHLEHICSCITPFVPDEILSSSP
ncbi:AAA family ATPase [candidate division KSB1 bacterium]|nr:AAA family ATPase [candidate division KSB1 bacterium]